mgnify:CR=1 FL=1|tara:strand:- start:4516 stop:6864 length:2349 start_codon:yes stop_codon:yes gene_type:complete
MPTGQLIATIDCFTQEIILDVTGGTASGDFLAFYPDGTSQVLSGELPLTTSTYQDGVHTFTSTFLDLSLSTVTSVDPATLDIDCFDMSYIYICLFNLNNAYEKAKCINDKEAETEKIKLDRAMQLIALIKNFIECGVDTIQKYKEELTAITNCDNCTTLDDDIFPDSLGCTDPTANNYDPDATIDNGSCIYSGILGCTNPLANNYDPLAEYDDGSCNYDVYGCTDPTAANYDPSATIDDGSCIACVWGCTDSTATNYNSSANCDDGSCIAAIYGCTDPAATNYDPTANTDDGSCYFSSSNCANNAAFPNGYSNYNPTALYDCNGELLGTPGDSSTGPQNAGYDDCCIPCIYGCTIPSSTNYDAAATCNDSSCIAYIYGCTDPTALNYYAGADIDDGSCVYSGCMDATASNYDPTATIDYYNECEWCTVYGCTDPAATGSYDPLADCDDGSCDYTCPGNTSIPDDDFENILEAQGYGNGIANDNLVLTTNICQLTGLNVLPETNIADLTGIEDFVDLANLYVWNNQLTSLDVSNNTALTEIRANNNQITSVNVTGCPVLIRLYLYDNSTLSSVDVSYNTALEVLSLGHCNFSSIDVSDNIALTDLGVGYNLLTSLDLSTNTALITLNTSYTPLGNISLTNNTALEIFGCYDNNMTILDVSTNIALIELACSINLLTSLNVSTNTALTSLRCEDNNLTSLDVSTNTALITLVCITNPNLISINLGSNLPLTNLAPGWGPSYGLRAYNCHANLVIHVGTSARVTQAQGLFTVANNNISTGTTFAI